MSQVVEGASGGRMLCSRKGWKLKCRDFRHIHTRGVKWSTGRQKWERKATEVETQVVCSLKILAITIQGLGRELELSTLAWVAVVVHDDSTPSFVIIVNQNEATYQLYTEAKNPLNPRP